MTAPRALLTRRGEICFPTFVPVTTFGARYPLDELVRPYLPRLASAVMVSAHYARQMRREERPPLPMMVDSGGFAALFDDAQVVERRGLGVIVRAGDGSQDAGSRLHPRDVLELQEELADVAFTLDIPISPRHGHDEARRRQELTIANAQWAIENRRRRDLPLYAVAQGWDVESLQRCVERLMAAPFEGLALGGLVPRAGDRGLVLRWVDAAREVAPEAPIHLLGLGDPELLSRLFERGVQSADSSSWVKAAARGRLWGSDRRWDDPSPAERLHLALCNLAMVGARSLPLSAAPLLFETKLLRSR